MFSLKYSLGLRSSFLAPSYLSSATMRPCMKSNRKNQYGMASPRWPITNVNPGKRSNAPLTMILRM